MFLRNVPVNYPGLVIVLIFILILSQFTALAYQVASDSSLTPHILQRSEISCFSMFALTAFVLSAWSWEAVISSSVSFLRSPFCTDPVPRCFIPYILCLPQDLTVKGFTLPTLKALFAVSVLDFLGTLIFTTSQYNLRYNCFQSRSFCSNRTQSSTPINLRRPIAFGKYRRSTSPCGCSIPQRVISFLVFRSTFCNSVLVQLTTPAPYRITDTAQDD